MRFSIVMPVYNTVDCLRETLDSVLKQTFTDWECLCIDDGSSDGSEKICDEYGARDKRFRVIHQKNKGLTATRNVGLREAKGEYICFLDCDDVILVDWLERANAALEKESPDILRMGKRPWHGEPHADRAEGASPVLETYVGEDDVFRWAWPTLNKAAFIWLLFVKREITAGFGFVEKRLYREDIISSLHLFARAQKVCQLDYPGYLYRERLGSMMHSSIRVGDLLTYWDEFSKEIARRRDFLNRLGLWNSAFLKYSESVIMSFRMWTYYRRVDEVADYPKLREKLLELHKDGMLEAKAIPPHWRIFYKFYLSTGAYRPMEVMYRFAIKAVRLKNRLLKGANA